MYLYRVQSGGVTDLDGGEYPTPDVVSAAARHIYGAGSGHPASVGWSQMDQALRRLASIGLRLVPVDPDVDQTPRSGAWVRSARGGRWHRVREPERAVTGCGMKIMPTDIHDNEPRSSTCLRCGQ